MPFIGGGVVGLVLLGLVVFCVLDVIQSDESLIRNINSKLIWLALVVFLGPIGCVAWLVAGRPQNATFSPGSTSRRYRRDDDGGFQPRGFEPPPLDPAEHERRRQEALARYEAEKAEARRLKEEEARLAAWEDELRRREERLRPDDDQA